MSKIDFKKTVLAKAKEKQQEIIDDFKTRIEDLNDHEDTIEEDQLDRDQQALNASSDHLINGLADQLNFVVEEMDFLNRMEIGEELHETVALGSVVKTDKQIFYPSVSIEKFEVDGQDLFGISAKAPIYQAMKGKKAGETFECNNTIYTIAELY